MAASLGAMVAELKRLAPRLRDYEPSDESWQLVSSQFPRPLASLGAVAADVKCVNRCLDACRGLTRVFSCFFGSFPLAAG